MIKDFESKLKDRFNQKVDDKSRFDRNGHNIQFLLTLEEFRDIFEPFKDDDRFYDYSNVSEYLCLSRIDDLGDYKLGNVFVSTMGQNTSDHSRNNREAFMMSSAKGGEASKKNNPNGTFFNKRHKPESIEKQKKVFEAIGHQQGKNNSQYGSY